MSGFTDRENQLFEILHTFKERNLEFIVIGGYAVSASQHRFSVDADLVITAEDIDQFTNILQEKGYEKMEDQELAEGRFISYEKDAELPVSVDLMVGTVQTRQTGASWSYDELAQHAEPTRIEGSEESVTVRVPEKELLMAMKLHSGRQTDARDVVALAEDVAFDEVADYLDRGNRERLRASLERVLKTITGENFEDAFKGVFSERDIPEEQIDQVRDFLQKQIDELRTD